MSKLRKIPILPVLLLIACLLTNNAFSQMEFVENKGQWHSNVNYRGDFTTGSFFIENKGFTVLLHNAEEMKKIAGVIHGHLASKETEGQTFTLHSFAYKVKFLGASSEIASVPDKPLPTYNNYFIGSDSSAWAGNCRLYQGITYKNVYPNIDVRYYSSNQKLKYDFIIHPGGNPSMIAMQYDGPSDVFVKNKELNIVTPVGTVTELYPYSYQPSLAGKQELDCRYEVKNNVVTFQLKNYDPTTTVVIDPSIIFSTLTGSSADNWGYTATPGPDGSLFAGGISFGSGYPVSPGAYSTVFNGGVGEDNFPPYDIAIFKFSPNGSNRVYATYLGGSGNEQPHSLIVDKQG
ncbi:MAG: hypothetical protein JST02_14460, partial [Bacteroidetes bacterium]|nr:hypothetical protein [Bacteroidota bacterium]